VIFTTTHTQSLNTEQKKIKDLCFIFKFSVLNVSFMFICVLQSEKIKSTDRNCYDLIHFQIADICLLISAVSVITGLCYGKNPVKHHHCVRDTLSQINNEKYLLL